MNTDKESTTDPNKDHPIVVAIKAIANALSRPDLKVRSYKRDFQDLWGWAENPDALSGESVELVIIADGVPSRGHLDAYKENRFVEAVPWTLALAQAFVESERQLYLTVLATDPGMKIIPEFLNKPYVNIHWFAATSDGLDKLYDRIEDTPIVQTDTRPDLQGEQRIRWKAALQAELRRMWKTAIWSRQGESNSRHDVSNQAGAAIMSLCLYPDHARALIAFSIKDKHERALWISVRRQYQAEPESEFLYKDCGKVVLVDDNHAVGYAHVLRELLGCAEIEAWKGVFDKAKLDSDVDCAIDTLLGTAWEKPQAEFQMGFKNIDLLFLDLRLWTAENEDEVLKRYGGVAQGLATLPWIPPHIKTKLQSLTDSSKNGPHTRLALLPLILAAIDPSLPIVLFSSTRHRDVVHALRDVPNIVTDFAKPYIGSEDTEDDDPAQLIRDLRAAIHIVRGLTPAQEVWRSAEKCIKDGHRYVFHRNWEQIEIPPNLRPLTWLRNEWLLLAQRQEFALACAAFWLYLVRAFGPVALKIAIDSGNENEKRILTTLRNASAAPLMPLPSDKEPQKLFENLVVSLGDDFVTLLKSWQQPPENEDQQSKSHDVAGDR